MQHKTHDTSCYFLCRGAIELPNAGLADIDMLYVLAIATDCAVAEVLVCKNLLGPITVTT
jgi:hypothetical protein